MNLNINKLTQKEIQELEKYIKVKLKKTKPEINKFFMDLKSGKLKSKEVDIDSLNFVYDGLSELVEEWINKKGILDKYQEREKKGEVEKLVCAPNTKVGKFLSKYKNKQMSLDSGLKLLRNTGILNETLTAIAEVHTRRNYFVLGDHDLNHTKRVLVNASMLMAMKKDLSVEEREIVYTAIILHDTGRIHDFEDEVHGQRAVNNITNELDTFSAKEQDLIKFLIAEHCKSSSKNERDITKLDITKSEKRKYRILLNYLKDADKLDRVRFPELSPFMTDSLDPNRLYFDESKQLIKFACELLERFDNLFSIKNNKSVEHLMKRTLTFAEDEEGEQLANSVYKVLADNRYPDRSRNLFLKNIRPHESQFIKDGYIYLLRGSRKGQMSGFFTYPYSRDKKNVEDYLKKDPNLTADILSSRQSMKGKECFISTTTDINIASMYTRLNKQKNKEGSIYVLKVKPRDAFRVESPVNAKNFLGIKDEDYLDEKEYLIPDFVRPEEVIKEFRYNDFLGVFKFLKDEIGLNITPKDINLRLEWLESPELAEKFFEDSCRYSERLDMLWSDSDTFGIEILSQLINDKDKKPVIEEVLRILGEHDIFDL